MGSADGQDGLSRASQRDLELEVAMDCSGNTFLVVMEKSSSCRKYFRMRPLATVGVKEMDDA